MLKRLAALFLTVIVLLAGLSLGASAATMLDGLQIDIVTDKEEYAVHEPITQTITITNRNDCAVNHLALDQLLPQGYSLANGSELSEKLDSLAPGESVKFKVKYNSNTSESAMDKKTVKIILYSLAGVAVAGSVTVAVIFTVRAVNKKKLKHIVSIFLCISLIGAMTVPAAAQTERNTLSLTHRITVDGKPMTLNASLSYDQFNGIKQNFSVDTEGMLYDEAANTFVVTEEMEFLGGSLLYTEDVASAQCVVTDVNGNELLSVQFAPTNMWVIEGIAFVVGLNRVKITVTYESGLSYETSLLINNICEKNMSALKIDKNDDDQDGVLNFIELMYHTDPKNPDSDGDGLTDYYEMAVFGTDPMVADSDQNSVIDAKEDADGDGLTNLDEINLHHTSPICTDTDGDGIKDIDEIVTYKTDPCLADTDEDGKSDLWEIQNGFDPSVKNEFPPEPEEEAPDGVTAESDGKVTITIWVDNFLINENTPGFIGNDPVHVEIETGHTADITMKYDPAQLEENENPTLYYFDQITQCYEMVESEVTESGSVTATIEKTGVYVLLNHRFVEDVWENDIFRPSDLDSDSTFDVVFVVDRSSSMNQNDPNAIRKEVTKEFISKLRVGRDRAAIVQFNAIGEVVMGMTDDKEALINALDNIQNSDGGGCAGSDNNAGTNGSAGIREAFTQLEGSEATYKYVIFLTDGKDTKVSEDYGDENGTTGLTGEARSKGIIIHTVGLIGTGEVDIDLLKRVAKGTGGNYYVATVGEDAENNSELVQIYDQIEYETIDKYVDSNNDGISDFYTRLICDGALTTGTGANKLFGDATFQEIQANADYDGDGMLNGSELVIQENERGVFVSVVSFPYLKDSDGDTITDYVESDLGISPMKKNASAETADVTWLTNSEGFWSDAYLDYYNGSELEQGAVFIGNAFFGTTLDQTNLYKEALANYFSEIDKELMNSYAAAQIRDTYDLLTDETMDQILEKMLKDSEDGFVEKSINAVIALKEFVDDTKGDFDDAKELLTKSKILEKLTELADSFDKEKCKKVMESLKGYMKSLADIMPDKTKTGVVDLLNKCTKGLSKFATKVDGFATKFTLKFPKLSGAVKKLSTDEASFVIDLAIETWKTASMYSDLSASFQTMQNNIYILECVGNVSDNSYLRWAAYDILNYLSNEQTAGIKMFLDGTTSVLTSTALNVMHDAIAAAGVPGAVIELVRLVGNVVFDLDDLSKNAAQTVCLAASADILAINLNANLTGNMAVNNWSFWAAYSGYSEQMYVSILNLAEMRKMAENKMKEWQDDKTVKSECTNNATKCKKLIDKYNERYYEFYLK